MIFWPCLLRQFSFCAKQRLCLFSCSRGFRWGRLFPIQLGMRGLPIYSTFWSWKVWRLWEHQGWLLSSWCRRERGIPRILLILPWQQLLWGFCEEPCLWQFSRKFWRVLCSGWKFFGGWWEVFFSRIMRIWLCSWRVIRWYWDLRI